MPVPGLRNLGLGEKEEEDDYYSILWDFLFLCVAMVVAGCGDSGSLFALYVVLAASFLICRPYVVGHAARKKFTV